MKIIAFYLPQFHEIPENNEWWGKGFTEWTTLRKAKPLFKNHNQPRVPLNNNYYDLLNPKVMEWQCELAKEYGIYGFCFYHYWYDGHLLLEKPIEQFLRNDNCRLPFCICWANEHWTRSWESKNNKVLIAQRYGDEKEWIEHFNYLKPFLIDSRYIHINGKPLVVIYRPELIDCLNEMIDCWQNEAKKEGIGELSIAYQYVYYDVYKKKNDSRFDYAIEYQPVYANKYMALEDKKKVSNFKQGIKLFFEKNFKLVLDANSIKQLWRKGPEIADYDKVWNYILRHKPIDDKHIPGAFVDWDNTPRRGVKGTVYKNVSPEKFGYYLKKLIVKAKEEYHKDYIFLFAWNEWTEGGYLEPDKKYGYAYLEQVKEALEKTGEIPK